MSKKVQSKKDQFTQPAKIKLPIILLGVGIILVVAIFFVMSGDKNEKVDGVYFGEPVATERSYIGEFISMTTVTPVIEDGSIKLSFDEIDENNIVFFEVENNEKEPVPLMAYITPTGRLFVGSSLCEPCRGRTFSLAGETLVCDTCRTTYNIEDHQYISGSPVCGKYPPVNMNPEIVDNEVVIKLDDVLNWRTRI